MKKLPTKTLIITGVALAVVVAAIAAVLLNSGSTTSVSSVKPLSITPGPTGMLGGTSPTPSGELFVLVNQNGSANVQLLNVSSTKPLSTFPVSNAATGIASNATTLAVSQGTQTSGSVTFYNAVSHRSEGSVALPGPALGVGASANPDLFYALVQVNNNDSVDVVGLNTHQIVTTVPMPSATTSFAISPDGSTIYAVQGSGLVSVIGITSGKVTQSFITGPGARSICLSQDGSRLYVLKGSILNDNVAVVNLATEAVKYVLPAPAYTVQVQVAPSNTEIYDIVGNPTYGNIQIYPISA
jgi:hypothetical protein